MPRTYSFDHFTARPAHGAQKRVRGANDRQSVQPGEVLYQSGLHYGHAHAQTESLYQKHRVEHELQEALRVEAPRPAERSDAGSLDEHEPLRAAPEREASLSLAEQVLQRVRLAARESFQGSPRQAGMHLVRDAVTGSLHVLRQASLRAIRFTSSLLEEQAAKRGQSI